VKRLSCLAFALVSFAILAGCGGSPSVSTPTGSSGSTGVPGQTEVLGHATIKFVGKPQSNVSAQTGSISVVGASFTELNYLPATVLANSTLLFSVGSTKVWTYSNGVQAPLGGLVAQVDDYCFTHDGHILLSMFDGKTHLLQIFECYYDGSGLTQITSNSEEHYSVSVTPNNSAILYSNGTSLKTTNFSGGNVQTLGPGAIGKYSPNGTQIVLQDALTALYVMPASVGGTQTPVATALTSGGGVSAPSWSPDGLKLAFSVDGTVYVSDASDDGVHTTVLGGAGYDSWGTIGPDGETLAFTRYPSGTSPTNELITSGLDGYNANVIASAPTGFTYAYPIWSPYLGPRSFVGSGGSMSATAAGFLWSERASAFCSLVSYSATTASSATISSETSTASNTSAVFDLHADTITSLKYTNSYYVPAVAISPNVSDCLISFDSTTGFVTTVVPFSQTKTHSRPTRKVLGSVATYTGKFPAIYDKKGVNVAPIGASVVSLDLKSGKLVDWH
jgi:hypothetical protein